MRVPFVDLPRQISFYEQEIRGVFEDVVFKRADFIMRQDLIDFEREFAEFTGVAHSIGVANGSDALNMALKVLGIGPGDDVITVSHTFVATIAAIVHAGAKPILVDVADDYNMDTDCLEQAITKKTKAIIAVHLNGRVCQMDKIKDLAEKHKLFVVEDSAQAIGGMFDGKKAGSMGILSTNSFYPFKIIGCFGDGGAITTNDPQLNAQLKCMRDNGQDREKGDILFWGWNSRLDNLQAAILRIMFRHFPEIIARRREIAAQYCEALSSVGDLMLPLRPCEGPHYDVFQNYVIRTKRRDELVKRLSENGIGTLISWPRPTHHHRALGLTQFKLPNTEAMSQEVLSIPIHPALSDEEVNYVSGVIRNFFSGK